MRRLYNSERVPSGLMPPLPKAKKLHYPQKNCSNLLWYLGRSEIVQTGGAMEPRPMDSISPFQMVLPYLRLL